jgi:hypothetical protein
MQASNGGLVCIFDGGTGHVSVVGSTLTRISVRAHSLSTLRVPAHRGPRPAALCRTRRAVPHGEGYEYPEYRRRELCAACGMQAKALEAYGDGGYKGGNGGLVGIYGGGTGHVSVVGSTLKNVVVRARCLSTLRVPAHRGSRPAALCRTRRAVPHGVGCEYLEYRTGGTASVLGTHSALGYRRVPFWVGAGASCARRVVCRPMATAGS